MSKGNPGQTIPITTDSSQNSTTSENSTSTTVVDPITGAARGSLLGNTASVLSNPLQYYPGVLQSQLPDERAGAIALTTGLVGDPLSYASVPLADRATAIAMSPQVTSATGDAINANRMLMSPLMLDPRTNPWLAGAADAANRETVRQLTTQVFPEIRSGAIGAGQYGGSRQGVLEANALAAASQAMADSNVSMFSDAYQSGIDNMLRSAALNPTITGGVINPITSAIQARGLANEQALQMFAALDTSGSIIQENTQNWIDKEVGRYAYNQEAPQQRLALMANIINGMSPIGQTTTSSGESTTISTGSQTQNQPVPYTSPFQGIIGGATAGASLGSMFPGIGTAWGAGLGALAGLLFT